MKPRLTEIDLARLMHRDEVEQRLHIESLLTGSFPALTYNPLRAVLADLFNQQGELIAGDAVSWSKVEEQIKKRVRKGELEERQNLIVGKLLHGYVEQNKIWSRRAEFFPLKLAFAGGLRFWWDLFFVENERAVVPFVDPRLTRGLSREDMRVVFSFMHERIRVSGSDFEDCRLAIFQFPKNALGTRVVKITYDDDFELYSYVQLSEMVENVYRTLSDVAAENRRASARGTATGSGTLFG